MRRLFLLLGLCLTAAACSHGSGKPQEPAPTEPPVNIEVTNNFALPVEIYASSGSITQRLGTVHPGMVSHFVIPHNVVSTGSVEFQARPNNGRMFRSSSELVLPGAYITMIVTASLFNSTVNVHSAN